MSNLETMYPAQANSPYTTTLGEIAANDTAVVVADASVLPDTVPFLLTLGYDKSASETVLVTAVANNTLTITRGVDGNALLWVAGTKVARIFTAKDLNDVQANLRKLNQDKQENLAFDTTPTAGSTNPVTSGGIREALNLKANAASLASHTGNTNNPHGVTAEQVGAATPASVAAAIGEVSAIGDMKTSFAAPNAKWLECNGAGIYSSAYPELASLLASKNPFCKRLNIPKTYYDSSTNVYARYAFYRSGTWAFVSNGYKNSSTAYIPVVYYTDDLDGEWKEVRLSTDSYWIQGIFYNTKWYRWVVYGYKYVSSTECYPYIFHTSSLSGTWYSAQLSTNPCKITTGIFANNTMVFLAKGCGSDNSSTLYSFDGYNATITERVVSTSFTSTPRGLCWSGTYWAFVGRPAKVWYTDDITGTWTAKTLVSSGVDLQDMCYGNGTWCAVGYQNSGGSGRLFHTTDITGSWTDVGRMNVNDGNEQVGYSDGVFLVCTKHLGSSNSVFVSTDNCQTWVEKDANLYNAYGLVGYGSKWLIVGMYGAVVVSYPEADAVLPEIEPEYGSAYIKALN